MSAITVKLSAVLRFVLNDVGNTQIDHTVLNVVTCRRLYCKVIGSLKSCIKVLLVE